METNNFSLNGIFSAMVKTPFLEDNIKTNQSVVHRLIMAAKVNLLVWWCLLTGKIASYLKSMGKPHVTVFGQPMPESKTEAMKMIFDLPEAFPVVDEVTGKRLNAWATEYYIAAHDSPDEYDQTGPIRLRFKFKPSLEDFNGNPCIYNHYLVCRMIADCRDKILKKYPPFELLNPITPYKSITQTCRYFSVLPMPYAPYGKAVGMTEEMFTPSYDDDRYWEEKKDQYANCSEAALIEQDLKAVINNAPDALLRSVHAKTCEGLHKQLYYFNDIYGYPIMAVVKQLEFSSSGISKHYIPVVQLRQNGKPDSNYATLPLPDAQILYNLDKIKDAEVVVICPNLEIADYFQSVNQDSSVAFTAFLCDTLTEVDFLPLKDKEVCMMIVNHSGLSAAESLLSSAKLYNYLLANGKQKELTAVMAHVDYAEIPSNISSIGGYMNFRRAHAKARVTPGSIIEMATPEEFFEQVAWAENEKFRKETQSLDKPYWVTDDTTVAETTVPAKKVRKNEHLFYPIIARGAITYIAGISNIGKSNLTASICAHLVNTSERRPEIFSKRCWSGCKVKNGYDSVKILHLDFESGQNGIDKRERDFVVPYLPDAKEVRERCKANYIVRDLLNCAINYAEEAHWEDLCELIDGVVDEGNPGQPADILIVDTYQSFVQDRDCDHWVLKKLLERYPDMAIVVLHHLDDDGKFVGLQSKKRIAQATVYLTRDKVKKTKGDDKDNAEKGDDKKALTLHDNFQVQVKNCKLLHVPEDENAFEARFDEDKRFVVTSSVPPTKAEMVKAIKDGLGISKNELADLLGMGEEKLKNSLSGAKDKK